MKGSGDEGKWWWRGVVTKGSGDEGKWSRREVVTKGSGEEGKWSRREVVTKGSGEEGKWSRREVVTKGSGEEGKWWRREVMMKGSGDEGKWWGREVVEKGSGDEGKWWRREVVKKGSGDEGECRSHWNGCMTVAWAMFWRGSRSTKPCVFPCKVAAAGDEGTSCVRRLRFGSFRVQSVPPMCFATSGCVCVCSSMRFLNLWLQIALEWLHECCMGYVVGRKPEHETLCFSV